MCVPSSDGEYKVIECMMMNSNNERVWNSRADIGKSTVDEITVTSVVSKIEARSSQHR